MTTELLMQPTMYTVITAETYFPFWMVSDGHLIIPSTVKSHTLQQRNSCQ